MSFSNTKRPSQALSQLYLTNHCSVGQHSYMSNRPAVARISRELALIGCLGPNKTVLPPAFRDQSIALNCPGPLRSFQSLPAGILNSKAEVSQAERRDSHPCKEQNTILFCFLQGKQKNISDCGNCNVKCQKSFFNPPTLDADMQICLKNCCTNLKNVCMKEKKRACTLLYIYFAK